MAKQKICGVYKITNRVNGKIYVGSSKNIYERWNQHKTELNNGVHKNKHLQHAWDKYGEGSFDFSIIEECGPQIRFEREQYYLNILNPFDDNGYNIVRQISEEYMSDHYMVKKCSMCGKEFNTFSHLSKYCDECKEEIYEDNIRRWKNWIPEKITDSDAKLWGYDNLDDFWESVI